GSLLVTGSGRLTVNGTLTLNATNASLLLSAILPEGPLKGSGYIDVTAGTMNAEVASSAFHGTIVLKTSGTIQLGKDQALGKAALELDGGTLANQGTTGLALNNAVTFNGSTAINTGPELDLTNTVTVAGPSAVTVTSASGGNGLVFIQGSTLQGKSTLTFQ